MDVVYFEIKYRNKLIYIFREVKNNKILINI